LLLLENGHAERLFREADASRVRVMLKPYLLEELLEEVEAILSSAKGDSKLMMYSDLVLDTGARTVTRGSKSLDLTAREYELLDYMMRRQGEELTRSEILEQVWGREFKGHTNVLEVYIRYLRLKLESGGGERLIHNVRGVGYVLRDET
jgi:DNA-binding response OmpR family regulator